MSNRICPMCYWMYKSNSEACPSCIATRLVPDGCIAIGNEHGACMDRGCLWCEVYYDGPEALDHYDFEVLERGGVEVDLLDREAML